MLFSHKVYFAGPVPGVDTLVLGLGEVTGVSWRYDEGTLTRAEPEGGTELWLGKSATHYEILTSGFPFPYSYDLASTLFVMQALGGTIEPAVTLPTWAGQQWSEVPQEVRDFYMEPTNRAR